MVAAWSEQPNPLTADTLPFRDNPACCPSGWVPELLFCQQQKNRKAFGFHKSQNHTQVWVERDLSRPPGPTAPQWAGPYSIRTASSESWMLPGMTEHFQGWASTTPLGNICHWFSTLFVKTFLCSLFWAWVELMGWNGKSQEAGSFWNGIRENNRG